MFSEVSPLVSISGPVGVRGAVPVSSRPSHLGWDKKLRPLWSKGPHELRVPLRPTHRNSFPQVLHQLVPGFFGHPVVGVSELSGVFPIVPGNVDILSDVVGPVTLLVDVLQRERLVVVESDMLFESL